MQYCRFAALVATLLSYGYTVLGAPTKDSGTYDLDSVSTTVPPQWYYGFVQQILLTVEYFKASSSSISHLASRGYAEDQYPHPDGRYFKINGKTQRFAGMVLVLGGDPSNGINVMQARIAGGWGIFRMTPMLTLYYPK